MINMSFGSYQDVYSKYTQLAVDSDIICVAAAGNDGSNMPVYPASLDSVIAVGAYDTDNETITDYSNYGENVDVLAPGTTYTTAIGEDIPSYLEHPCQRQLHPEQRLSIDLLSVRQNLQT